MTTHLNTTVSLHDPAEVLAAVPHLLGFTPQHSVVLLALHNLSGTPRFGLTMRADLPCATQYCEFAEYLLSGPLSRQRPEAMFIVVVGDRPGSCTDTCGGTCGPPGGGEPPESGMAGETEASGPSDAHGWGPPHGDLVQILREAFQQAGILTAHAMWAPVISADVRWSCYFDADCTGTIPDPKESPVGAALAAEGSVTFGSKEELRELVAPESPEVVARWSAKLDALTGDNTAENSAGGPGSSPAIRVKDDLRMVFAAIERIAGGSALTEDDLLRVLLAVSDTRVRDIALSAALGPSAKAAEDLWLSLVRKAPDPELADVAALLAVSAYMRGEGALAGVALDRIEQAQPDHRLGILLRQAIESGLRPDELAVIVRDAAEDAQLTIDEDGDW